MVSQGNLKCISDHHSGVSCLTFGVELQSHLRHASWSWKFVHYYWRLQNSTSGMVITALKVEHFGSAQFHSPLTVSQLGVMELVRRLQRTSPRIAHCTTGKHISS
jgi:hypothetical protein